ncbi:anucleate primary sterigmata protein A [Naviculisporaceae sp. PSN 640]
MPTPTFNMATSVASDKAIAASSSDDPFITNPLGSPHLRHSNFDSQLFALNPATSAGQVKRAIEAHLRDTQRRMEEAGKLGTALVQQQKELQEKLREVEQLQAEAELNPELRQRLAEIEKDYNEVARESARAFLPKQRIPSNEGAQGSPFAPEGKGGRRSVSPSKFESLATASPTKLSVPNRKLRNQPANRIHDIEFAAEISTSLIAQVRNLQALLAEKEEELKDTKAERNRLELEAEGFQQRMKTLDESENRYKDENWNLETQIHELLAAQKEATEREKKLTQNLAILQSEKNATQRELEEVKDNFAKQDEKHAATIKNLEIELGTIRRNAAISETERTTMQKKVEELTSQNQELAKAFTAIQRGRALEREANRSASDEDLRLAPDNGTPEHSPPPSPIKGTPRHSMLESETLKTSLGHAQRTIQTLRTNIHREKTEKLELRRMLQDLRDELEKARSDMNGPGNRRSRKVDSREFKKPMRLNQLGGPRTSKTELVHQDDDPEWEDHDEVSSHRSLALSPPNLRPVTSFAPIVESSSDHFDTANETSDAAFETAHERATETEDFQTGAEDLSEEDEATETEASPSKGSGRIKRPSMLQMNQANSRYSFDSTASTSADEDEYMANTPTTRSSNMRLRSSRSTLTRRTRQLSEEPQVRDSPSASFVNNSNSGTPQPQSLFAELGDLDGSDEDSYVGAQTPSRRSVRSFTPGSATRGRASPRPEVPALPRLIMVDSGVMTDPVDIRLPPSIFEIPPLLASTSESTDEEARSARSVVFQDRPMSMESVVRGDGSGPWLGGGLKDGEFSRPLSSFSYSDASVQHDIDMEAKLAQFPSPPTSPPKQGFVAAPVTPPAHVLEISAIHAEEIEPVAEVEIPQDLGISSLLSEHVEPREEVVEPPAPPPLSLSSFVAEDIEPVVELVEPPALPPLALSSVVTQDIEPVAEVVEPPAPPPLGFSSVVTEDIEPVAEPEAPAPALSLSSLVFEHVEPVAEVEAPQPPPPVLTIAPLVCQDVEPRPDPEPPLPPLQTLSIPTIVSQAIEPVSEEIEPEELPVVTPVTLTLSDIRSEHVEPIEPIEIPTSIPVVAPVVVEKEPPSPVELTLSSIIAKEVEPQPEPEEQRMPLTVSYQESLNIVPDLILDEEPVALSLSSIKSVDVMPLEPPITPPPALSVSHIQTQGIEPIIPEVPEILPAPLSLSSIQTLESEPIIPEVPETLPAPLSLSSVQTLESEPIISEVPEILSAPLSLSSIQTLESEPVEEARSPKRNAFIIPRDVDLRPKLGDGSKALEQNRDLQPQPSVDDVPTTPAKKPTPVVTSDQEAQTSLTSEAIDQILKARSLQPETPGLHHSSSFASMGTPSTVRIHRPREGSIDSTTKSKGKMADMGADAFEATLPRRPGSAASGRASLHNAPPLPPNHKEVIEAARTGSSSGNPPAVGSMGPPLFPASALRSQNPPIRPRTPNGTRRPMSPISVNSGRGTPTPRAAAKANSTLGTAELMHSPSRLTHQSRKSSVSSFASEIDTRFNMQREGGFDTHGFGPNTDPRMIQAITQTMIGEYLWKYTRKAGREELSGNRHRRYFWVHPYTRTLYWSDRDPSSGGRSELRAKSVPIEAVRVVTDDNPMPPGLHRKSLVIVSPGRTIKFTCTTGQRHETWFNALSYLLLRTNNEGQSDAEEMAGQITREDVDEFNPTYGRRVPNGNRTAASLSSYNSRTIRTDSPVMDMSIPTLTPTPKKQGSQGRPSVSTIGRISGYWKDSKVLSGTFGSIRSRSVSGRDHASDIYEASEVQDSAEDLREMIERQDREADRLENVRACCDGKHDVGTLTSSSKRGRPHRHTTHTHAGPSTSTTPTRPPAGTTQTRA